MQHRQPIPTEIKLRRGARILAVTFDDGTRFELPFEYLRVYSPSAEVRGHGMSEPILVAGKQNVRVTAIEPVGNYAVRLQFDDGHNTGLYSWTVLYDLGTHYPDNWRKYLQRLEAAGLQRAP